MSNLPTIGGVVTRGEVFTKMLHHLRELQDMTATMAHLHNTEGNDMDKLLAKGWLGITEMFKQSEKQIIALASKRLQ